MAAEERPLPNAVSVGDELLVAVIHELRGLRADLASGRIAAPPAAGVELREPKGPTSKRAKKGDG